MILTTEQPGVRESTPPSRYQVEVPATNPLMPTGPVSLVKEGKEISLNWDVADTTEAEGIAKKIVSESLARSREQVERHPESSRAYTNLGVALLNAGSLSEAVSAFRKALELDSGNYVANINLAKALTTQGRFDEAGQLYQELDIAFPGNLTPLMGLAYLAMRQNQFAEAEKLFRNAISRRPATPVPFYHLAVLLLRRGETNEAIHCLRTALRHNTRSAALYQTLGVAYALAGQNERSATAFKTALTLSPNLGAALKALANTFVKINQTDAAIDLLSAYLDREPEDRDARLDLARAYMSKQRFSPARAQLMKVFASCSSEDHVADRRSELANDIGFTYFSEREFKEAEQWFRSAIRYSSSHGTLPYRNLARLYTVQERYIDALEVLGRSREIFGDDADTTMAKSFVYAQLGEYNRAISDLESLVSNGTDKPVAYSMLGWLLADVKHDYGKALKILSDAYSRLPADPVVLNDLAYVHLMLGNTQAARSLLEHQQLSSKSISDVALTATRGLLYLREGNQERARHFYRDAATLASHLGQKTLADKVRQKMHLEFAQEAFRTGDTVTALNEVNSGLATRKGRPDYEADLVALQRKLLGRG